MSDDRDLVLGGAADDTGTTRQRRGAAMFDLLVVGWAVGMLATPVRDAAPVLADGSFFVLWVVLVAVEGVTGSSPGKHVTGVDVQRLDGGRVSLVTAARRRPWGWLLPLQFLGPVPNAIATATALGTLLVMLVSVERSDDRRGFHDRLAGTVVAAREVDPRARIVTLVATLATAVLGIVLMAATTPVGVA